MQKFERIATFIVWLLVTPLLVAQPIDGQSLDPAACEKLLRAAKLPTDGPGLLQFFRDRTLSESDRAALPGIVKDLSNLDFDTREAASERLKKAGIPALGILRTAARSDDPETAYRAERAITAITTELSPDIVDAATTLLAVRKPSGSIPVLLNFLACLHGDEYLSDSVRRALTIVLRETAELDPQVLAVLKAPDAETRAGILLVLGPLPAYRPAIKPLLNDPSPLVRYHAAAQLLRTGERASVAILMSLLEEGPIDIAYQAEDLLCRLLNQRDSPTPLSGTTPDARKRSRLAWEEWWKANGSTVDLTAFDRAEPMLGLTLIVEVDNNGQVGGQSGRLWEADRDGKQRWELTTVSGPVDCQILPGRRLLLAEYYSARVTERDRSGKILWESPRLPRNPVSAQRLPNGNTLIATGSEVIELNRDGKPAREFPKIPGEIHHAIRGRNGNTYVLARGGIHEIDIHGKELRRIAVRNTSGWAGLELLPNGNFLVSYYTAHNCIIEHDADGKELWVCPVQSPTRTQRLANGNILVAGGNQPIVQEFNRDKKVVRQTATQGRPFSVVRY